MRFLLTITLVVLLICSARVALGLPFFDSLPKYTIDIDKNDNKMLVQWLQDELNKLRKTSSVLKAYTDPKDIARYERGTLQKLLRSRGYYNAQVHESLEAGKIYYRISPGQIYRIKAISVFMPDHLQQGFSGVKSKIGDPLDAKKVISDIAAIKKYLNTHACLFTIDVKYEATIINNEYSARLVYRVPPSPEVNLGKLRLEGLTTVDKDYLRNKLKLKPGDCFNRNKIDIARLNLLQTNLVAVDKVNISAPYHGVVDITFMLKERKHRTISWGIGFTSDEGAGVSAGWEHRNIFHHGEKLKIETKLYNLNQSLKSELSIPNFFRDDQSFTTTAEISKEERESYDSRAATIDGTISRSLSKHRIASIGSELKFSTIKEEKSTEENLIETNSPDENFQLLSFPLGFKIDTTDKLLDARRGATAAIEVNPYFNLSKKNTNFVKNTLVLTGYLTAAKLRYTPTLAVRVKVGVISGINTEDIPADERFYAGGAGSVRGYGYQDLGPTRRTAGSSTSLEVIGGRALSELSLEGRFRFTKNWGGVIFLDGGNAYADPIPRFDSTLRWGAGIGIRYITSFAPLRLDLAMPLERRTEFDDPKVHIYVSLGQAF